MKRKYPVSYFILGVFQNFVRYFLIGLIGIVLLVIGFIGVHICKIVGTIVLLCYVLLCIIEQLFIRSASLKQSDNPEFNQIMDSLFGVENHDENNSSFFEILEDKMKAQDDDKEN